MFSDMLLVISAIFYFFIELLFRKSLTSSISFNSVCFCASVSIQASRKAYRGHQKFTDAFCQVPESLCNKQWSRMRYFDCSIHQRTNSKQAGMIVEIWTDLLFKYLTELFIFMIIVQDLDWYDRLFNGSNDN